GVKRRCGRLVPELPWHAGGGRRLGPAPRRSASGVSSQTALVLQAPATRERSGHAAGMRATNSGTDRGRGGLYSVEMSTRSPQLVLLAALLLAPTATFAQEDDFDLSELRQEIEVLRREVKALRTRIDTLEAKREGKTASPSSGSTQEASGTTISRTDKAAELRARWSRVMRGMTGAEVTDAIGEPAGKLTLDGRPVWYYVYAGIGRGSVIFDGGGRVSSWQAPTPGWSW